MTRWTTLAGILALLLVRGAQLRAAEPGAPDRLPTAQEVYDIKFRQALTISIDTGTEVASDGEIRSALKDFYTSRDNKALWIDAGKLAPAALSVSAVVSKAGDYALKPEDYPLPPAAFGAAGATASPEEVAKAEVRFDLSVLRYAHDAHVGRVNPEQVSNMIDRGSTPPNPKKVLEGIAKAGDAGRYLLDFHPQHPQFELLRKKYLELIAGKPAKAPVVDNTAAVDTGPSTDSKELRIPRGPTLRPGDRHPQIVLLRQRLGSFLPPDAADADATSYDDVLAVAVRKFQADHNLPDDGIIDRGLRQLLNATSLRKDVALKAPQAPPASSAAADIDRILVNMQRWRWMREDLGEFYVLDNVPEFLTRVVDHGNVIFTEKIVTGKPDTPTPTFSQDMQFIEFHPFWNVPNSIKELEILPSLQQGGDIMDVQNLRAYYKGQPVDASSVDWTTTDIKNFEFQQPPSQQNVLGVVKFMFPNKFDVYMHDTPTKSLFNKTVRAYSHGCMRVHNPEQLAALLLEHDQGWSKADVERAIADGGNQQVRLQKQIPVHVTYFTAWVQADGSVSTFGDWYGHDNRLALALNGKTALLAQEVAVSNRKQKPAPDPGFHDDQSVPVNTTSRH